MSFGNNSNLTGLTQASFIYWNFQKFGRIHPSDWLIHVASARTQTSRAKEAHYPTVDDNNPTTMMISATTAIRICSFVDCEVNLFIYYTASLVSSLSGPLLALGWHHDGLFGRLSDDDKNTTVSRCRCDGRRVDVAVVVILDVINIRVNINDGDRLCPCTAAPTATATTTRAATDTAIFFFFYANVVIGVIVINASLVQHGRSSCP